MKLNATELAYVRCEGLHLTEKCDGCGKLLNQAVRYTIAGRQEVYCSANCRDLAFFRDRREARKHASPGKCVYCRAPLEGRRRGALYCDGICKQRFSRKSGPISAGGAQLSGTAVEQNERVANAKIGG